MKPLPENPGEPTAESTSELKSEPQPSDIAGSVPDTSLDFGAHTEFTLQIPVSDSDRPSVPVELKLEGLDPAAAFVNFTAVVGGVTIDTIVKMGGDNLDVFNIYFSPAIPPGVDSAGMAQGVFE